MSSDSMTGGWYQSGDSDSMVYKSTSSDTRK